MKKLNNIKTKLTAKALTSLHTVKETLVNNRGSQSAEWVILLIIAVVVGGIILATSTTQLNSLLGTVSTKINAMFS